MKNILETIKQPSRRELSPWAGKLKGLLFLGCLLVAGEALAGVTYRMVGGTCTDSNHGETLYYPEEAPWGIYGPGPKACSDSVTAEITMADGYIPGTQFSDIEWPPEADPNRVVMDFTFSDGARTLHRYIGAPPTDGPGTIDGALPATTAPAEFLYIGNSFLRTRLDGTWEFRLEFSADDVPCGIGSVVGPNNGTGFCAFTNHYAAIGTYEGWQLVPEPSTLALALAALAGLGFRRRPGHRRLTNCP